MPWTQDCCRAAGARTFGVTLGMEATAPPLFRQATCARCGTCFPFMAKRGPKPKTCAACKAEVGSRCIHRVICQQCGRETWKQKPQQFCSDSCWNEHQHAHAYTHDCKQCGRPFRCKQSDVLNGRSYCSDTCRKAAWRQDQTSECGFCGKSFVVRGKSSGVSLYCSRQCASGRRAEANARNVACDATRRLMRKLIRIYANRLKADARAVRRHERAATPRACVRCGKLFRNGNDRLCSVECRQQSRKLQKKCGRRGRIAHGHGDRCKLKGLPYDPSVTADFVHERDNWKCVLCGQQTVRGDRRLAPTVGHIVPLKNPLNIVHGHVANNTYTNCAACNGKQGNAVMIDGHQNCADPRQAMLEHVKRTGYPLGTSHR